MYSGPFASNETYFSSQLQFPITVPWGTWVLTPLMCAGLSLTELRGAAWLFANSALRPGKWQPSFHQEVSVLSLSVSINLRILSSCSMCFLIDQVRAVLWIWMKICWLFLVCKQRHSESLAIPVTVNGERSCLFKVSIKCLLASMNQESLCIKGFSRLFRASRSVFNEYVTELAFNVGHCVMKEEIEQRVKCGLFVLPERTQNSGLWFRCEVWRGYLADLGSHKVSAAGLENSSLSSSATLHLVMYETAMNS